MRKFLQSRSLRFWITLGMAVAVLPLLVAAILGYALLDHGVIGSYRDIVLRQDAHAVAIQDLRLKIAEAMAPVDEFIERRDPDDEAAYRRLRSEIESRFAALIGDLVNEPSAEALVRRAQDAWTSADGHAAGIFATGADSDAAASTRAMALFHAEIASIVDKLSAAYDTVSKVIDSDLATADRFYERALWVTGIAAVVSLACIALGIFMIGRIVGASVTRIVNGAALFAEGDRAHRIEVQVPAELREVADEFNRMAERIRDSEGALAELAQRDALTGLANRRALESELSAIEEGRAGLHERDSVLVADIDHFKLINDIHGHAAGDDVLRAVGRTLLEQSRPTDKVFRIGGEEFALLLPQTDEATARSIAERLRQAIAAVTVVRGGATIRVTISIGVAATRDRARVRDVIEAADAALYVAKSGGRNRVVLSGEPVLAAAPAATAE